MQTLLCSIDDIPDGGCRESRIAWAGQDAVDVFLIRHGNTIRGYVNRCPHTGSPLNWLPDRFLDESGALIICDTHAARFRIEDGYCVSGPCAGDHLRMIEIEVRGSQVYANLSNPGQQRAWNENC